MLIIPRQEHKQVHISKKCLRPALPKTSGEQSPAADVYEPTYRADYDSHSHLLEWLCPGQAHALTESFMFSVAFLSLLPKDGAK